MNFDEEPLFLFIQKVKAFVGSNPIDPGEKTGVSPEFVQVFPHLNKNLLSEIIRIFMFDHHFTNMPVNTLLVFL